ncbi:MAG: RNA polymerase sigma factor [Planctomycetota bacterium]|jgi:RNA polymerase sigma-70 factor (ECF subfamily)
MNSDVNYIELVRKAQLGDRQSMSSLARLVRERVYPYIYRLTLNYDLAQDLSQETLLTMFKSLKRLRFEDTNRFWRWVFQTATGKIKSHFRNQQQHKMVQMSIPDSEHLSQHMSSDSGEGLKRLISNELSDMIYDAMVKLNFRQRNVLTLRCFEQLPYSEIAAILDCSEFAAQVLFFRAKRSLKRQLSKHGFSKGLLLTALAAFARATTPAKASSSAAAVTSASTKVSLTATVIGAVSTKLGVTVTAAITAAALTIGGVGIAALTANQLPQRSEVKSTRIKVPKLASSGVYDYLNYFPEGIDGPVFRRAQRWNLKQDYLIQDILRNGQGSYIYHYDSNTIYMHNTLRSIATETVQLVVDPPDFTDFIMQNEGTTEKSTGMKSVYDKKTGLLAGVFHNIYTDTKNYYAKVEYNTLDETDFIPTWPLDAKVVDNRDVMHKRGWTYFRVLGEIDGEKVEGFGQIPFVYNALAEHPPLLKLDISNKMQIIDIPSGAYLTDSGGNLIRSYPAGGFFKGLGWPWMGIHSVDTVRRDAAERRAKFNIEMTNDHKKAVITVFEENEHGRTEIIYSIDMYKDVIKSVKFITRTDAGEIRNGFLQFSYLQDINKTGEEFAEPIEPTTSEITPQESMPMLWLIELAQGTLGQ